MTNLKRRASDNENNVSCENVQPGEGYRCASHEKRVEVLEEKANKAEKEQILINAELKILNKNVERITISLDSAIKCLDEILPQVKVSTQWGGIAKTVVMVVIIAICQLIVGYIFHNIMK